jgi:hypothetical protein
LITASNLSFSLGRVEGRGNATISEVSVQTKHLDASDSGKQGKREELQKELEKLQQRRTLLTTKQHRLKKQRTVLDGFADNVVKGPVKTDV